MSGPVTRLGLQLAGYSFPDVPDADMFTRVAEVAVAAENAGFDSLWTMDHLQQIDAVGDREEPILEAYTTLAALAAITRSAKLGVLVTACGFRNPALLAKMVTSIDVISRGRAILGIGSGWHEEEYRAYGMTFPSTRDRMPATCRSSANLPRDVHPIRSGVHRSASFDIATAERPEPDQQIGSADPHRGRRRTSADPHGRKVRRRL